MQIELKIYPGKIEKLFIGDFNAMDLNLQDLEHTRELLYEKIELTESEQVNLLCDEIKSICKLVNKTNIDEHGVITHTINI